MSMGTGYKLLVGVLIVSSLTGLMSFFLIYSDLKRANDDKRAIIGKKVSLEVLLLASKKLGRLWREGDIDNLWRGGRIKCPFDKNVGESYLRCNPVFIDCVLENYADNFLDLLGANYFKIKHESGDYQVVAKKSFASNKFYKVITRSNTDGVKIPAHAIMVELYIKGIPSFSLKVLLESSCKEVFLPRRVYASGTSGWRWDNFNRSIFVDKYLVTNSDISDWFTFGNVSEEVRKEVKIPSDPLKLSEPATNIKMKHMKSYCLFRGAELLRSHVFDAAAFYPVDLGDIYLKSMIMSPYPWTKKERRSFLYAAQNNPDFVFNKSFCDRVYSRECLKHESYRPFDNQSGSWAGVFQILGGYPEAFENKVEEFYNLKASSFYFNLRSRWHRLGQRAYWNGEGFFGKDFNWTVGKYNLDMPSLTGEEDFFRIGLRCMRTLYNRYDND